MMLYLAPKSVKMNKAVKSFPSFDLGITSEEYKRLNPSGVFGDPTKATKEKGRKLVDSAVKNLVNKIK
jgi:creatinine amidohydrolase